MTLSPKVNLPHAMYPRALCGANLVKSRSFFCGVRFQGIWCEVSGVELQASGFELKGSRNHFSEGCVVDFCAKKKKPKRSAGLQGNLAQKKQPTPWDLHRALGIGQP